MKIENIDFKTIPKSILYKTNHQCQDYKKNIASKKLRNQTKNRRKFAYNSNSPSKYNTCNDDTTDHQEITTYGDSLATYQLFRYRLTT